MSEEQTNPTLEQQGETAIGVDDGLESTVVEIHLLRAIRKLEGESAKSHPEVTENVARLVQFLVALARAGKVDLLNKITEEMLATIRSTARDGIDHMSLEELGLIVTGPKGDDGKSTKKRTRTPKEPGDESKPPKKRAKKEKEEGCSTQFSGEGCSAPERIGPDGKPITSQ